MSTADRAARPPSRVRSRSPGQGGYTFIEIAITLVIVSLMALVVERVMSSTNEAERFLNAIRRATERGQRLAYEVHDAVSASRKIYGDDAVGAGYLAALDLARDPPLAGARLPTIEELRPLGPDLPGEPRTGNMLLFVREGDAAPAVADPATGSVRHIDTYRFVCVYPREVNRRVLTGKLNARDLVIWRSVPFPSHPQILAIANLVERGNVVRDLYERFGHEFAWNPNAGADASFYALDNLGNVASTPSAGVIVEEDGAVSARGRLVYAHVQLARTDAKNRARRPVFTVDDPDDWSPEGFEVKVTGASGSRKVWIRLVVETQATAGRVAVQESSVIASTRDL